MSEEKSIIQKLQEPLLPEQVQIMSKFIRKVSGTGNFRGLFLLHKSGQTVVDRFNEVCGMNWQDRYFHDEAKNLCCEISVKDAGEWIKRIGVGSPIGVSAGIDKEKSRYTDAFKRASDKFGIGRELKFVPPLFIDLTEEEIEEEKGSYSLSPYKSLKYWEIKFDNDTKGKIKNLQIFDEIGKKRWPK